jgi:general secretion pathway protein G
MNKKYKIRNPQSAICNGFTLMELMVVIAIIVLLAGIMTPNVAKRLEKAKMQRAESDIAGIETAIAMYENDLGTYPPGGIDFLETCLTGRDSAGVWKPADDPKWSGPYIKGIDKDSWGNDYVYLKNRCSRVPSTCPGTLSTCPSCWPSGGLVADQDYPDNDTGGIGPAPRNLSYYIYSWGKNKNTGNATEAADDVNNWDVTKIWREKY